VLRRRNFAGSHSIEFHELKVIPEDKMVYVNEKPVSLTPKEFDLLLYLLINKNRVINKSAIAEHLWSDEIELADSYDFIYSHMKNLRKKLLDAGGDDYIHTVYGMGYKFGDA
jgi:DNA-binding response OmpR family regulator